ncbi:MAG TPA: hypothetical protein VLX28_01690 [Thermoanaerobaculia bacterium]|nr:hypothetical protein [Thermoanaerobaculia bacterium]
MEDIGADELIARHAHGQEPLGIPERCLGAPKFADHPLSVAQMSVGAGLEIKNPMRVVGFFEILGDLHRQLGVVGGFGGVFEPRLQALSQQELAEAPGLKAFVVQNPGELLVEGKIFQDGELVLSFRSFPDGHSLVPVTDFILESANLPILPAAFRAKVEEVRDDLDHEFVVTQIASQQLRHDFE